MSVSTYIAPLRRPAVRDFFTFFKLYDVDDDDDDDDDDDEGDRLDAR